MNLTKNEKKVLNLLLLNSRTTDSQIANKLRITSQAVGKIRRKLEASVIQSYSVNIDYTKLGINVFAISLAKLTNAGIEMGELEVEQVLLECPNVLEVYRLPNQNKTHAIIYGFEGLKEFDEFFHNKKEGSVSRILENCELFTFSGHSRIKNDPRGLLDQAIGNLGKSVEETKFSEIKQFKRRIK